MARSPPLNSEMLCNCLPGGFAEISIPQLSGSFSSSNERSARPPSKSSANISLKLARTWANVSANNFLVVELIREITSSSSRRDSDLNFQRRLAHLPMAAFLLQLTERIAQAAQLGFPFLHCPEPNGTLGRDFVRGRFRFGCARGLFLDRNFSVAVFLCLRRELAFVTGDIGPAGRN